MTRARPRVGPDDQWFTTKQAADYLSVTPGFLYELASAGMGPARRRLSGRWYYLRSDIDQWMLSEPHGTTPGAQRARRWREEHQNGA